jgi:4-hydroxy-2-oxoheptanedioate aldolase
MRENTVRTIWQHGAAVINGWLAIPSTWSAELMAHQGWDSLTIDTQHGLIGYDVALPMLQAISTTSITPLARAPWNEPGGIMKLLDAGAMGIICPMINSGEEAEAFVGACRYAPKGYRSAGPTRAGLYAGADYMVKANETVITMAMIETAQAVQNVDEIMSTPGLDGIYIGPNDLGISLGLPSGAALNQPKLAEAIEITLQACKRHGIIAGIHTSSTADAINCIDRGFQFVTLLSDTRFLADAARSAVTTIRERKNAQTASSTPY